MSDERRVTSEELALFAMQLLPQEEMAEVAAVVASSAEARRELAEVQGDLAAYAHTVELHSPPALARERLMRQVAREKKAIPIDRIPTDRAAKAMESRAPGAEMEGRGGSVLSASAADAAASSSEEYYKSIGGMEKKNYLAEEEKPVLGAVGKVLPWIGWAVAAGLAVVTGNLYHERDDLRAVAATQVSRLDHVTADAEAARQVVDAMTDSSAMRVTLTTKAGTVPLPTGRATYVASKGTLIFLASNLEALAPEKTYELWLIPAGAGQNPIPAGTFRPDARGNASVIMPPLPKGVEAKAFGVTVEAEGGSATPTLPIVLAGE
ncbi:MAG: anti-sigma factor [Edaphobacter sp.]